MWRSTPRAPPGSRYRASRGRHLGAQVVRADHVEIGAIAGGKHCGAVEPGMTHQVPQGRRGTRRWDGRSLPHSQWSGAKAQPGGYQSHHERV